VPLLDFFKNNNIGVVGINMLDANKKHLQAAGNFPSFFNLLWMKLAFKINSDFIEGNFKKEYYEVDWLTGSLLLLPKKVYNEVGGFDEDYFLYVEDVDFCKRIADKGYKRLFVSTISYIHFVGFKKEKNPLLINGYKIYINKHFKGIKKRANSLALFINSLVKKITK
jgi:GT2 family glycosyltransferase